MTENMELFYTHLRDMGQGVMPIRPDDRVDTWIRRSRARTALTDDEQRKKDAEREGM